VAETSDNHMRSAGELPPEPLDDASPQEAPPGSLLGRVLHELEELDVAVYQAIEATPTPLIDAPLRRLSNSANHAKLYMAIAALLFAAGGKKGRRAAVTGMAAVGLNSFVVNVPMKLLGNRPRPERGAVRIAEERLVKMPTSTSFPSGHSASGFAFAAGVAEAIPALGIPLRGLATVVAYSRVHSGVHYPGDVVVGSLVGMAVGESTVLASRAVRRRLRGAGDPSPDA
jgi:membrane-associated phospholipid phosphatase